MTLLNICPCTQESLQKCVLCSFLSVKNQLKSVTRVLFKLCGSELRLIQPRMTHRSQSECQSSLSIIPGSLLADNHNNPNPLSFGHSQLISGVEQTSLYNSSPRLQSRELRRERHEIRIYGNESIRLNSDRQIVLSIELLQRRAALYSGGTVLNTIRRLFKQRER